MCRGRQKLAEPGHTAPSAREPMVERHHAHGGALPHALRRDPAGSRRVS